MKKIKIKKDVRKAVLLALCPGLGFLYLESILYWLLFLFLIIAPIFTVSNIGNVGYIVTGIMYGISIFYTYVLANETLKNKDSYKKDPYYILCLTVIWDGLGQIILKQEKKGIIMMIGGLSSCLVVWAVLIFKFGLEEVIMAPKGEPLYSLANYMTLWLMFALPVKFLSLMDAYYSTYHLYVAEK